jgi:hypothetical protein
VQDREGFFHTSCAEKVLASRGAPISGLTKDDGPSSVLVAKELEAFPEAPQTEKWKSSLIHVGDATFQLSLNEGELHYEMRNCGTTIQGEFSGLKEMLLASQRKEDAERIAGLKKKEPSLQILNHFIGMKLNEGTLLELVQTVKDTVHPRGYNAALDDALRMLGEKKEV